MDAVVMVTKFMPDLIIIKTLEKMKKALQERMRASMAATPAPMTPSAIRKGRKRSRRILKISRTPTGTRVWYMGKVFERKNQ